MKGLYKWDFSTVFHEHVSLLKLVCTGVGKIFSSPILPMSLFISTPWRNLKSETNSGLSLSLQKNRVQVAIEILDTPFLPLLWSIIHFRLVMFRVVCEFLAAVAKNNLLQVFIKFFYRRLCGDALPNHHFFDNGIIGTGTCILSKAVIQVGVVCFLQASWAKKKKLCKVSVAGFYWLAIRPM